MYTNMIKREIIWMTPTNTKPKRPATIAKREKAAKGRHINGIPR
jgi:hypothetical protein